MGESTRAHWLLTNSYRAWGRFIYFSDYHIFIYLVYIFFLCSVCFFYRSKAAYPCQLRIIIYRL